MKKMEGEGEISSRACPRCCERDEIESRKNMEGGEVIGVSALRGSYGHNCIYLMLNLPK